MSVDESGRKVRRAASDARSEAELSALRGRMLWDDDDMLLPLDEETLDERETRQMGGMRSYDQRRRDDG